MRLVRSEIVVATWFARERYSGSFRRPSSSITGSSTALVERTACCVGTTEYASDAAAYSAASSDVTFAGVSCTNSMITGVQAYVRGSDSAYRYTP